MISLRSSALAIAASLACAAGAATAKPAFNDLSVLMKGPEVPVNVENFVRAATEIEMEGYLALSGGVNRLFHVRELTPIAQQPTIRMNRDTIYSMAVVDVSEGATLTVPEPGARYVTAHVVNQDHFTNAVFYGGGTFTLDQETFDTPYVAVLFRILVDESDPEDMAAAHALQDGITLEAASARPFAAPPYDRESFESVLSAALALARWAPDGARTFGPREAVDPVRHFLGTAFGWGGLPEEDAVYLNVEPGLPVGAYRIDVPAEVPVQAFWSVSVYNADGFFDANDRNAYNINSITGERDAEGGVTVHLGGCEDDRPNCLPLGEGWNYVVRLYRPSQAIIDGDWTFPEAVPAD
ncbi:MAG: DUF1254 domain-containing protein [Pseudomonadota bacterium]